MSKNSISLLRAVKATRIPIGEVVTIPAGTLVYITQALGGTYTVSGDSLHGLFLIDSEFADALGIVDNTIPPPTDATSSSEPLTEEKVWDVLKTCYDPEIPVNIVDLGLIYLLKLDPEGEGKGTKVSIEMTLTAQGCGMGPVIAKEAQQKVARLTGVSECRVDVVWEPHWTPARISAVGREKLGMI